MKGNKLLIGFGVAAISIGIMASFLFSRTIPEDRPPLEAVATPSQLNASQGEAKASIAEGIQPDSSSGLAAEATDQNVRTSKCPLESALPSVSDIKVASCEHPFSIAKVLEQEARDPGWASDMEAQIHDLIDQTEGLTATRLDMECRMTSCGVLLIFRDGPEYRQQKELVTKLTEVLKNKLGFRMWGLTASGPEDGEQVATISLMHAAGREQFQPERPTLSALPGVPGFDIPLTGMAQFDNEQPAKRLADEAEDPIWAQTMESRVMSEVSAALNSESVSQLDVKCRSTMCGIAMRFPPGSEPQIDGLQNQLAETLEFERGESRRYPNPSGMMVTIYLQQAGK